jgi:hypothetical protein
MAVWLSCDWLAFGTAGRLWAMTPTHKNDYSGFVAEHE